jgi:hypothetical protein
VGSPHVSPDYPSNLNEQNPTELNPSAQEKPCHGVTRRVVLLSLLLAAIFGYAIPVIDYKLSNTFLGGMHLPPGAVGVLLILVLVINPLLRLGSQKWGLSRNESLTVYLTCLFSSLVPGHGAENYVIPNLLAPFYYATRQNKWLDFLQPYLKPWLTPALTGNGEVNTQVIDGWYVGLPADTAIPWGAWLVPMTFWMGFVLVSYVMLGCLSVILRAQWGDNEALAFPLLRLPLEMTEDMDRSDRYTKSSQFFRNPLMWTGFSAAVFIQLLRGLNLYYPDVPTFPLEISTAPMLTEPPWNQLGGIPVAIFPMVVGITYMLTAEISFSLWFFYWFFKFQLIAAYYLGFPAGALPSGTSVVPGKLFTGLQQVGAFGAYVAVILWIGREHLKHVARRAFGRAAPTSGEKDEILSYPLAFWGFVSAFSVMVGCTCMAGVRLDIALALWISYLVSAIGLTRVAVEGGLLALQHHTLPLGVMARLFNTGPSLWITPATGIVPASLFQACMVHHMRGFIMPSFVHSFKLAYDRKIAPKPLGFLLAVVILLSVVISWWTSVRLGYETGGLQMGNKFWSQAGPQNSPRFVDSLTTKAAEDPVWVNWVWLSVGASLTYGMMVARSHLMWFPLHPIGYLMGLTWPTSTFWSSIFLGWLIKVVVTRYGGTSTYRKLIPTFLGLALGDVAMMLFWLAIDGWQGRVGHLLMPG